MQVRQSLVSIPSTSGRSSYIGREGTQSSKKSLNPFYFRALILQHVVFVAATNRRSLNPFYFRALILRRKVEDRLPIRESQSLLLQGAHLTPVPANRGDGGSLNPFYFRALILPRHGKHLRPGYRLNPFYFRALILRRRRCMRPSRPSQSLLLQGAHLTAGGAVCDRHGLVSIPSTSGRSSYSTPAAQSTMSYWRSQSLLLQGAHLTVNPEWVASLTSQSLLLQGAHLTARNDYSWRRPSVSIPSTSGRSSYFRAIAIYAGRLRLNPFYFRALILRGSDHQPPGGGSQSLLLQGAHLTPSPRTHVHAARSQSLLLQGAHLTSVGRQNDNRSYVSIPSTSGRSSYGHCCNRLVHRDRLNPFYFRALILPVMQNISLNGSLNPFYFRALILHPSPLKGRGGNQSQSLLLQGAHLTSSLRRIAGRTAPSQSLLLQGAHLTREADSLVSRRRLNPFYFRALILPLPFLNSLPPSTCRPAFQNISHFHHFAAVATPILPLLHHLFTRPWIQPRQACQAFPTGSRTPILESCLLARSISPPTISATPTDSGAPS